MKSITKCYLCGCDIPDLEGMEYYNVNGKDICVECYKLVERNKKIREMLSNVTSRLDGTKDKGDVKEAKNG